MPVIPTRDVTIGATSATVVAPKVSDTLTLSQPMGGIFAEVAANIFPCAVAPVTSMVTSLVPKSTY